MNLSNRAVEWSQVPILLSVPDLQRRFGLSRQAAYNIANCLGLRIGRRLMIPKARLQAWLELEEGGRNGRGS